MDVKLSKAKTRGEALVEAIKAARSTGAPGVKPSKGLATGAQRAVQASRALEPVFKAVERRAGGQGAGGATRADAKLALVGKGPTQRVRTNAQGSGQVSARGPRFVVTRNAAGMVVERVPRFSRQMTQAEESKVRNAVKAAASTEDAPVATGTIMHGVPTSEHEYMDDKRGRVVRATGAMLLDTVSTGESNNLKGRRTGLYLISPAALGGRLALLAKTFEQHKAIRCTIIYSPVVPTTQAGALMFYARNDVTAASTDVGPDELRHAATHPDWMQTPVWKQSSMEIQPSNINVRYFDDENNPADSIQSILQIECADDMDASKDYGNVFIHYDFEFYAESLDYSEGQQITPQVECSLIGYNIPATGTPFSTDFYDISASNSFRWVIDPGSPLPDSFNQVFYGVVTEASGDALTIFTVADATPVVVTPGQGFYLATTGIPGSQWTNGSVSGALFTQFPSDTNVGNMCLFAGLGVTTANIKFSFRAIDVNALN